MVGSVADVQRRREGDGVPVDRPDFLDLAGWPVGPTKPRHRRRGPYRLATSIGVVRTSRIRIIAVVLILLLRQMHIPSHPIACPHLGIVGKAGGGWLPESSGKFIQ